MTTRAKSAKIVGAEVEIEIDPRRTKNVKVRAKVKVALLMGTTRTYGVKVVIETVVTVEVHHPTEAKMPKPHVLAETAQIEIGTALTVNQTGTEEMVISLKRFEPQKRSLKSILIIA